jgi:hypothetical protein
VYGFNTKRRLKSSSKRLQLDPQLAMAYWGIAISLGSNYNVPADGRAVVGLIPICKKL